MKKIIVTILLGILFFSCNKKVVESTANQKPNVLFIAIDDLNHWIEPLGGNEQAHTPNLMKFSKEAVNFTKAYCASPGCNPSRGAILTGYHTYTSGLYSNYQDWRKIPKMTSNPTLNSYFKENGYYTAGAGKIYHYTQIDTTGWDTYFPSKTQPMPKEYLPEERPLNMPQFKYMYKMFDWGALDIADNQTGDYKSVGFIKEQLSQHHEKPFFLACGIYRPHVPWYVPKKYFDLFPLDSIKLPATQAEDLIDISDFAKKEIIERGGNYHSHVLAAQQEKKAVQGYLASMAYADAMFGDLIEALNKSTYAENTIVVLWSDHGWQLGEKEHWRKFALWENVNKSMLMFKSPKIEKIIPLGSAIGNTNSLASLVDIYPTLIELAGLPPRKDLDGKSLVPILKKPKELDDRAIITTYDYGSYSVRYKNWHYIQYIDGSIELYNLETDPREWTNLHQDPTHNQTIKMLATYIPENPVDLPLQSLIPLQEHHIAPIQSKAHYRSKERIEWMKRFEGN
jgi:arylsulfatase A-like enzyme